MIACLLLPVQAAETWIAVSTPHFQLFTTGGESQARVAVAHFEQVRAFFQQTSPFQKALDKPVRIIAFTSPERYAFYSPSDAAASFYTKDDEHDEIVMRDLEPEHFNYAVHEYTHLVVSRAGVHMPVWMNEGWADLNSTLAIKGHKAMIGDIIAGRRDALLTHSWIPLEDLDKIDQRSPLYNERDKASVFYGESWALMHMLFLSPKYRAKFDGFVRLILSGKNLAAACWEALGKSASGVQADLKDYMDRGRLLGAVFTVNLDGSQETAAVEQLTPLDSGLFLADLLTLEHKYSQAQEAYVALGKTFPDNPEIDKYLGYLEFKTGNQPGGVVLLKKALADGSKDAVLCYRLGVILRASNDFAGALQAQRRALELNPEYTVARLELGIVLLQKQDFAGSLLELQKIRKVPEENAPWYFSATAIDNAKLGHSEEARKNASLARKWAKSPAQVSEVEQIIHSLDSR